MNITEKIKLEVPSTNPFSAPHVPYHAKLHRRGRIRHPNQRQCPSRASNMQSYHDVQQATGVEAVITPRDENGKRLDQTQPRATDCRRLRNRR